jgi:hypothetical protein
MTEQDAQRIAEIAAGDRLAGYPMTKGEAAILGRAYLELRAAADLDLVRLRETLEGARLAVETDAHEDALAYLQEAQREVGTP